MSKSRGGVMVSGGKRRRVSDERDSSNTGDIGLIESIALKNFMCHRLLGPFQFGPNVNFIVGNNGSGKSAILTALIVGLGGKATDTNRGTSVKDFVKTGETSAEITVKLRNRGLDAFKRDVYGDSISIERRIFSDGSRTCKLRSETGQLISNKKEELTSILDHFNIQLDNPVSILNQEMSKQFLHSKSESDKYQFFMKATLLDQMKRDFVHIKQTKTLTRQQVERQEEALKDLKLDFLQKKERFETLHSFSDMKELLPSLQRNMAWSLVRDKEQFVQRLKEDVEKEESNPKHQENLKLCQTKLTAAEQKLRSVRSRIESGTQEHEALSEGHLRLKEQLKVVSKEHNEQEIVYFRALNKFKESEREQNFLQEKINKTRTRLSGSKDGETEYSKQQKRIVSLRKQLEELEETHSQLNEEIKNEHQALFTGREERDKLRLEERNIQVLLESKVRRRNQVLASRSNKLKRFGDQVPDLMISIDEANAAGRFKKKPIGPLGAFISLKDPLLAAAVEACLRGFMKAFCCDNHRDEALLQEIMRQHYTKGNRPQINVSQFSEKLYNLHGRKALHTDFPSLLDVITVTSPVVFNCLIDMRGVESILIIKENEVARQVMQQSRPPKNCREAFTADGDQVFPNRYYTSDCNRAKYLGGDLETEISVLDCDLENLQAHLSRFQLQVCCVSADIQKMENGLNRTVLNLKRNLASVNQVKASISELEAAGEEHIEDVCSLEEVAEESRQKMEAERQAMIEEKEELEKHGENAENMESEDSSVRERIDRLCEEVETLKEEQLKLEAECSKHEQSLQILEKKLKSHVETIREMKSDLAQTEEELQECVSKASEISPQRQVVSASSRSLDTEITLLQRKIQVYESIHGEQQQVVREYAEALSLFRQKSKQVRDLRRFIDRLEHIISDRQSRYKVLRRSLSVRCKLYFNNFMIKMNCCGSMIFDHNNETLSISVMPPGREDEGVVSDMRSLSGGERSFSTVCFMLSLWEITESPFRCLDEFDVYMDMHNRRISLDLLLELSERQTLRQFIFVTPLTTSNLPKSRLIKIHKLQDPERICSEAQEEEEDV
ncbi:hypothetical protein NQZ68_034617 [Dissostichus eleginoides]|nr:hypothetical protein NQZ68_034617 [Dissostichus eleginoides]